MKLIVPIVLALSYSVVGLSQIPQARPEFCGMPGQIVSLPPEVHAAPNRETGEIELFVRSGVPAIRIPLWDRRIDQICPLPDGRLVVFGRDGTSINIVDRSTRTLVDTVLSYDPTLSPDKRWIVYRKFYPRSTELPPSDEYLLYDLSKSPEQNRPSVVRSRDPLGFDLGLVIYPVGWKNESSDNIGAPAEQQHGHTSPFFWAPDSGAIVFSDEGPGGSSLVRISIGEDGSTTASVYPLSGSAECGGADTAAKPGATLRPSIKCAQFGPREASDQLLFVNVETTGCSPKTLQLHSAAFQAAKAESRVIAQPTKKAARPAGQSGPQ